MINRNISMVLLGVILFSLSGCEMPTEPEPDKKSWEAIGSPAMASLTIQAIAVPEQAVNQVYVGTFEGIYKSTDSGNSWKRLTTGLTSQDITSIAVDPLDANRVFCGSWGKGVFVSQDGGETWSSIWQQNHDPRISALTAVNVGGETMLWAATENGVIKTSDFETWQKCFPNGRVLSISAAPNSASTLFIGVRYKGNFRSTDGGETWTKVNQGIYATSEGVAAANSFAFDYANPAQVYISTGWIDLFKTENLGDNWSKFADVLEDKDVVSVASDKRNSKWLWAATAESGVYRSVNGGETWEAFNEGLKSLKMKKICIASGTKSIIYAGTQGKGLFKYVVD